MKVKVMQKGDRIVNVTADFIAIERASAEVDIIPIVYDSDRIWIDTHHILTIGFGENTIDVQTENGVTITTF